MQKSALLKHFKLYVLREQTPSPLLFFIFFVLRTNYAEYHNYIEWHLLALFLAIVHNYNALYILPSFIFVNNNLLSALFFLTSALSCNRKWKVFLFLFTIADSYYSTAATKQQYICIVSIALCIIIYNSLIFQTNKDNLQYFIGFFMFSALNVIGLFANSLEIQPNATSLIFIAILAGYLSKVVIEIRLKEIRQLDFQSIKNPRLMSNYIEFLLQDFKVAPLLGTKLERHIKNCKITTCYCKTQKYQKSSEFYLRQMFQNFMKKLGSLGDQHLWQYYIQFYLKKSQVLTAYYYLVKWVPSSYFSIISKLKCQAMIIEFLEKENSLNPYEKEYIYGLEYDQKCLFVSTQIHQILKMKIFFWKEVAKEYLNLRQLQALGCEIVTRMYELNKFYNYTIKQYEKYLFCFDSTILYGMYLISTTNFKDYAKGIIKSTSKLMEEVCVSERNASQTFAIRAIVKSSKNSFIKQDTRHFKAQRDFQTLLRPQQNYQNEFKLVIDAVSSGLCRMLNVSKQQIIGNQLSCMIPNCYKEIHNARLSQILDFNSDTIKELSPSKVLHAELKLQFRGLNDELFSGLICIKYHMDIKEGVTFLSVIKKTTQKECEALVTLGGQLMQKEKSFPSEIMKHSQVKKYLEQMRETWQMNRTIKQQKFNIMVNRSNYEITISSPYAFLTADKECLRNKPPPIHIQILFQENNKLKSTTSYRNNNADYQIKKMEMMINCEQQSSTTSSSKNVNSAVNIISNFSQNNSVPIYKYIIVTFLALLLCNISLNLAFSLIPVLPWDNTVSLHNPIIDKNNLYLIEILQTKAMLNLQDSINYKKYKSIMNDSRISSYYTGQSYSVQTVNIFRLVAQQLKEALTSLCYNYSVLLWPNIQQRLDKNITFPNTINNSFYSDPSTLTVFYRQAILTFTADSFMIAGQRSYDGLLIDSLYNIIQKQVSNVSAISSIISDRFKAANTQQVIFGVIFMAAMIFLVIPMCFVLRKRFKTHERVFDLLSSVECSDVTKQIQSLLYISNILNNYNESQEKLKLNVLDYQANSINPKHSKARERKPSVMNELVMGLQKFDVISNSADSKNHYASQNMLLKKLKSNPGDEDEIGELFINIKSQLFEQITKDAQIKGRKRSGELDLGGSQFDEKKCVIGRHCALYLLLLSFLPFIINLLLINFSSISYCNDAASSINDAYDNILMFNKKLYQTKVYLWGGPNQLKSILNVTNTLTLITPILAQMTRFDIIDGTESKVVPAAYYLKAKLSQYATSLRMIEGQITSTLKNLAQFRYNVQNSNVSISDTLIASNLYQNIFYLQSLNNQRQFIIRDMANVLQQAMLNQGLMAVEAKKITLIILIIWSAVSFGIGLILTFRMKKQFFKEVYILTFLNDEMLLKNKRVESYLDSLSKNIYF